MYIHLTIADGRTTCVLCGWFLSYRPSDLNYIENKKVNFYLYSEPDTIWPWKMFALIAIIKERIICQIRRIGGLTVIFLIAIATGLKNKGYKVKINLKRQGSTLCLSFVPSSAH